MNEPITEAEIAVASAMWSEDATYSEIGERIRRSRCAVSGMIRRNRDRFPPRKAQAQPWTEEDSALVYEQAKAGRSAREIAALLADRGRRITPHALINRPEWGRGFNEHRIARAEQLEVEKAQRSRPAPIRFDVVRWRHPETGQHISLPKLSCQPGFGEPYPQPQATGA